MKLAIALKTCLTLKLSLKVITYPCHKHIQGLVTLQAN